MEGDNVGGDDKLVDVMGSQLESLQPAVFIGHGSPMNAITENTYTATLREWGEKLRAKKPRAVVVFSAHWETEDFQVLSSAEPRTIHDFYGFPRALFELRYPAKGEPELAGRVADILKHEPASITQQWGFDHGVWSVMKHLWPKADIPIVPVSLSRRLDPESHIRAGRLLRPLRSEGVMILGSGNIVHNLREMSRDVDASPANWNVEFDKQVASALLARDEKFLAGASRSGDLAARKALPTREHYMPLLPIFGASYGPGEGLAGHGVSGHGAGGTSGDADAGEVPQFFATEYHHGTLSMRSVAYGV